MTSSYISPVRKPACTSPRISEQRLQACSETKKRLTQESFCMCTTLAAAEGYGAVVVTADDTAVMVLCLVFSADIS